MLWLLLTALAIILGAELNSESRAADDTLTPRPAKLAPSASGVPTPPTPSAGAASLVAAIEPSVGGDALAIEQAWAVFLVCRLRADCTDGRPLADTVALNAGRTNLNQPSAQHAGRLDEDRPLEADAGRPTPAPRHLPHPWAMLGRTFALRADQYSRNDTAAHGVVRELDLPAS